MGVHKNILFFISIGFVSTQSLISFTLDISDATSMSRSDVYRDYLLAELNLARKAPKESLELLHKLSSLSISPEAKKHVEHALVRILSKGGHYEQIIVKNKKLFENDVEVQLLFAEAYINTGRLKEAESVLRAILKKSSASEQAVYFLGVLLVKQDRKNEAIEEIDSFLSKNPLQPKHALFYLLKAKVYISMQKGDDALAAVDKGLELYPELDKAWLMRALILQNKNDSDGAITSYKRFLDISPKNDDIRRQLVMLLVAHKRFKDAQLELEKIKDESDSHYFNLALVIWKGGDKLTALSTINKALEKNADNIKAKLLKVELLAQLSRMSEAVMFVQAWLATNKGEAAALKVLLALKKAGASTNEIIASLESLLEQTFRRNIVAFLSDLYFEVGLYDKALLSYHKLEKIVRDSSLRAKLLYQIGYANFITGHMNEVEAPLLEVLKIDSTHPKACNLLASYYAHENNKLPHALKLIDSALTIDANNASFLDTKKHIVSKLEKSHAQ